MNTQNPIAAAVAAKRNAVQDHAEAVLREKIEEQLARLGEKTLDEEAPYCSLDRNEYARERYRFILAIGVWLNKTEIAMGGYQGERYAGGKRFFCGRDDEGIERLVARVRAETGESFDAYIEKLVAKVGNCDAATIEGDLWNFSTLTVTKGETVERWRTQQILNVSVYGRIFNQWPTRLMKGKKAK